MKIVNKIVMTLAGVVLIAASILKIHELLVICVPGWREHGIWESYEFTVMQIPMELCLGIWLVSGLFRKASWLAGTLAYGFFVFVTLYKGIIGAESCGCFGQVHVNPWLTLGLVDIPMVLLLLLNRPGQDYKLLPPPWPNTWHAIVFAVPIFAVLLFVAPALIALKPVCIKPDEPVARPVMVKPQPAGQEKTTVETKTTDVASQSPAVEPASHTQPEQWSWLQYIDVADRIREGLVVVLMYHHDCPTCATMVPKYDQYYRRMKTSGSEEIKIVFVAIPPYNEKGPVPADTVCLCGKLSDKQKWEINSPYVVALIDGQLVKLWKQGTAPEPETIMDEIFSQQQ